MRVFLTLSLPQCYTDENFEGVSEVDLSDIMRRLSACSGVPDSENSIARITTDLFTQCGCRVSTDALMNVYAETGNHSGPVLFVCAHQNSGKLLITDINQNGTLSFEPSGVIDTRVLPTLRVRIDTEQGPLPGIIGALPPHLTAPSERKHPYSISELFIDTGLPAETVSARIRPGMLASPLFPASDLSGQRFASPFASAQAYTLVMLYAAELLRTRKIQAHVCFAVTAQDDSGKGKAAGSAAFTVNPDLAIVVNGTHAPFPGDLHDRTAVSPSVVIGHGPRFHPKLEQRLFSAAQELKLSCGMEVKSGATSSEADWIQITGTGIPTGLIGIPVRFLNTVSEVVSLQSVEDAARLIVSFAESLDEETENWLCF